MSVHQSHTSSSIAYIFFRLIIQILNQTLFVCLLIVLENVNIHFYVKKRLNFTARSNHRVWSLPFISSDSCLL